ncbi:MAG: VWA domain-containing protein [Verrucomicrobia bacterium]|nr:VWA domain-containing protein [Verrucomicrobiota bacterium]
MNRRTPEEARRIAESLGPAEKLVELIINFPDHLWHNRPGVVRHGKWKAATRKEIEEHKTAASVRGGEFSAPGPNAHAIEQVYRTLAEIWQSNNELAARLAAYVMKETDWRDMKVVCAAFMLVQSRAGEPITEVQDGRKVVLFYDDDHRAVGEAMIKLYERGSNRMLNPKLISRIGEVLALPGVVAINRRLGFGNPHKRKPFTGRYYKAVTDWLEFRETNLSLLEGLKKAGYASTVRDLCRIVGYKPKSKCFFEVLGWKQKQAAAGHRTIGLTDLQLRKLSFDGLSEQEICERIVAEKLGWKQVMGMLPKEVGLTPAICVALLDQFSDKDLTILTPTLEELGLLKHEPIKARWQRAIRSQEDQRARNIAKNIRDRETAKELADAADAAVTRAVTEATKEADIQIMFLIDTSGSMQGAIETSKEALSMIVQGFPPEKLHIASFNTVGTVLKPRHHSAAGVQHMLKGISASGGTVYGSAIAALRDHGVRIPAEAKLIVFPVGDEAGESGDQFAQSIRNAGYSPSGFAHIVNVAGNSQRGNTVRRAAEVLGVPYTEVAVEQFTDVYQVQRTLKAVLEAQPYREKGSLIEKIMQTELLVSPY